MNEVKPMKGQDEIIIQMVSIMMRHGLRLYEVQEQPITVIAVPPRKSDDTSPAKE